ncbi:MAG: putative metal-binding motif-containing protein [Myxococcota bacterium]
MRHGRGIGRVRRMALCGLIAIVGACEDGSDIEGVSDAGDVGVDGVADAPDGDEGEPDAGPDAEDVADVDDASGWGPPCDGCPGTPCDDNGDCLSGWCVDGPEGSVCTKTCQESCPEGWSCRSVQSGSDVAFICVYLHVPFCAPCRTQQDCAYALAPTGGNRCVSRPDGAGSFCATPCEEDDECPGDATCEEMALGGDSQRLCQPVGECACSTWAVDLEASTTCAESNEHGSCEGGRTCTEAGLTACDAATPAEETCDGTDEDCDGEIDEDFSDKGGACDGPDEDACEDGTWVCGPGGGLTCDDDAASTAEICNGVDDDCDGETDEGFTYPGVDGVGIPVGEPCGVGLCTGGTVVCDGPGAATCSTLGMAVGETCDDVDENCDGVVDDGCDDDQDGWCDEDLAMSGAPAICPAGGGDCEDVEDAIHPEADERCNGVDDDCDGETDEEFVDCPAATCGGDGGGFAAAAAAACEEGVCVTPEPTSCGLYTCDGGGAEGEACATSCEDDSTCVASAHCDETSGECVPDVADGGACLEASDCESGHCENGFCCAAGDCCAQPADCPGAYRAAPTCDEPSACQGTRVDAVCEDHVCASSPAIEDDSACGPEVQAKDCSPNKPVYCTGAVNQTSPICSDECEADSDCLEGFHCDGTCQPDVGDGQSCDEPSDCASGHCENGFCCAEGDCCSQPSDCPDSYRAAPVCNDAFTCQGERVDATCEASTCDSKTVADDSACDGTVESNPCGLFGSVFCSGETAQVPPSCPATCEEDADCDDGAHCDGTCQADKPDGGSCDEDSDCLSGHCDAGVCCAGGDCCGTASDCPASYATAPTCDFPTTCQGTADVAACKDHVCITLEGVGNDSACDASVTAKDCGPYPSVACTGGFDQVEPGCPSSCTTDAGCDPDAHCVGGTCVPDLANGEACEGDAQCRSDHCENGFCCASGDCCAEASDCDPAEYGEPSTCLDASKCQGQRRDPACVSNRCQQGEAAGDDSGCAGQEADTCGSYPSVFCGGGEDQSAPACPSSCEGDADCDNGSHCDDGACVPDLGTGEPCGASAECAAGLTCVDGVCCGSTCAGDCRRCDLPGSEGTCAFVEEGLDPDDDCGAVSCDGWYHGFEGGTCYERADVSAGAATCDGAGACLGASALCPTRGQGDAAVTCDPQCQSPAEGTCTGTTAGSCTNLTGGTITCGTGVCERTVQACVGGAPNVCEPGTGGPERCNGFDDDCDGLTDAADPDLLVDDPKACENQQGVCDGCTKPASLCDDGAWQPCTPGTYASCSEFFEAGSESSCDGRDNDCDGAVDDDFESDVDNCGSCGHQCTNAHGGTLCAEGACVPTCDDGWKSCDADPDDGCETSVRTLDDCGDCGVQCSLQHATETCATGTCLVDTCSNGWCDEDGDDATGCEHDLDTNPSCGSSFADIGTVRGDTGSDVVSHTAYGEKWLKLVVSEGNSDALSLHHFSATLALDVPSGADYDLDAWCDDCTVGATVTSSTSGSVNEVVKVAWREKCLEDPIFGFCTGAPSGSDSGRTIWIRIRHAVANTCSTWSLTAEGDTGAPSNTCSEK